MRKYRNIFMLVSAIVLLTVGYASAETVSAADAAAYANAKSGSEKLYYASLEDALTDTSDATGPVYLLKDAWVPPEALEGGRFNIMGKNHTITIDVSGVSEPSVEIMLSGYCSVYDTKIITSDSKIGVILNTNGTDLMYRNSSLQGSIYGQDGDTVYLFDRVSLDCVEGLAHVSLSGYLSADFVEGRSVLMHSSEFYCTADTPGYLFRIHNRADSETPFSVTGNSSFHCSTETYELLKSLNPAGDGIPAAKLDVPVSMNFLNSLNMNLSSSIAPQVPVREGQMLMIFGYNSHENSVPSGVTTSADSYHIQYAEPYSVECSVDDSIRKLYKIGDAFPVYMTGATVTWKSGTDYYREFYKGSGTSGSYGLYTNIYLEGIESAMAKLTQDELRVVWEPVDGTKLTCPVMELQPYALVNKLANVKRVYGTHKPSYCQVTFDANATQTTGTILEDHNTYKYRVELGGSAVFAVTLEAGYEVEKVEAANCTVKQTGTNEYTLSNIQGDTAITVYYDAHAYEYNVTMVNGAYGFVDLEETNLLTIGAADGYYVQAVIVNGKNLGSISKLRLTCDSKIVAVFSKIGETADISKYLNTEDTGTAENTGSGTASGAAVSNEKLIAGVKATTIKASTVNVVGTKIRVSWKKSPGYKVDYYQIFRSTKRNSGYGTKPIYTTKSGKATSYTNSKNLKVGTRYYYKVRGVRVIDGKKYYTQYSNKAYRTAKYTPQASGKY